MTKEDKNKSAIIFLFTFIVESIVLSVAIFFINCWLFAYSLSQKYSSNYYFDKVWLYLVIFPWFVGLLTLLGKRSSVSIGIAQAQIFIPFVLFFTSIVLGQD